MSHSVQNISCNNWAMLSAEVAIDSSNTQHIVSNTSGRILLYLMRKVDYVSRKNAAIINCFLLTLIVQIDGCEAAIVFDIFSRYRWGLSLAPLFALVRKRP
ncbi:unnamed protein product [Albugo candida]|uniref:Uncharacterized protein n=1 Tax=Albugo candida TaxID=65357 RepID=A0A024G6T7_9STRA|nr:unnamed protein product [Albugo candida]|eukprot:CCI42448.1 unnamed protein product [Albugo candida]